jgi:hypothetical protein
MRDDILGFAASSPNSFVVRQKSSTVGIGSSTWDKTLLLCFTRLRQDPNLPTGNDITKRKQRCSVGLLSYTLIVAFCSAGLERITLARFVQQQ